MKIFMQTPFILDTLVFLSLVSYYIFTLDLQVWVPTLFLWIALGYKHRKILFLN